MPEIVLLAPDRADAAAWDDLWRRAPQQTPFTHPAFARAMAAATGRPVRLAAVETNGRLSSGCVVALKARGRLAGPPPSTRYTGVLLDPVPGEGQLLQRETPLDALLTDLGGAFSAVALSLTPDFADVRPFQWSGFACSPLYTYRLDDADAYRPDKPTRRRLRQMPPHEIVPTDPGDAAFVAMLLRHYRERGQHSPFSPSALGELLSALSQAGLLEALILRNSEGEMLAAQALLVGDAAAYLWMAGSLPGPGMTALQDAVIRRALSQGQSVDLLGANLPSIAAFKHHFGGRLAVHYQAVRYRGRALRALGAVRPMV